MDSDIKETKINDCKVTLQKNISVDTGSDCRGSDLFPVRFSNIFICAKKNSGKTALLSYVVRKTVEAGTVVVIFSSTSDKDPVMKKLIETLKDKGNAVVYYNSIKDDFGNNMVKDLSDAITTHQFDNLLDESGEPIKIRDWIIIFDDMGNLLKNIEIVNLAKKNRHLQAKIIYSSQYFNDLDPQTRTQIDYLILFPQFTQKKLQEAYKNFDMHVDEEKFFKLYEYATRERFNFLYCDIRKDSFRRNFDMIIN